MSFRIYKDQHYLKRTLLSVNINDFNHKIKKKLQISLHFNLFKGAGIYWLFLYFLLIFIFCLLIIKFGKRCLNYGNYRI